MALSKRTYIAGETKFTAQNLNDIQDAVIALEDQNLNTRLTTAEGDVSTLQTSLATLSGKFRGGNLTTSSSGNTATHTGIKRCIVFIHRRSSSTTPVVALVDAWGGVTYLFGESSTLWAVTVTNVEANNNTVKVTNNGGSNCSYGIIEY